MQQGQRRSRNTQTRLMKIPYRREKDQLLLRIYRNGILFIKTKVAGTYTRINGKEAFITC